MLKKMLATKNYQHRPDVDVDEIWDRDLHRTIAVRTIVAKGDYLVEITRSSQESRKGGIKTRYSKAVMGIFDADLRIPTVDRVKLHPDYDIVCTGGPFGTHYLSDFHGLPQKIEDYTDEQIQELLRKLIVPPDEIHQLRRLELTLRESNPRYRISPFTL